MRALCLVLATAVAVGFARPARAQADDRPLSQIEVAVACAPPTTFDLPAREDGRVLHLIGSQETARRSLFGASDLLVVDGGTNAGVQLNQQYFVRRQVFFGTDRRHLHSVTTLGWVRVVAVNETTAIATVTHMCNGMTPGDYLEPYAAPSVPAETVRPVTTGELDFGTLGRIVVGPENRGLGGTSSVMLIDRGAEQGSSTGAHLAIYRDLDAKGVPLSAIGEAVVVSVGKSMSLAWITKSRDAVVSGDYVVPRK
jgi:hypothetical protein